MAGRRSGKETGLKSAESKRSGPVDRAREAISGLFASEVATSKYGADMDRPSAMLAPLNDRKASSQTGQQMADVVCREYKNGLEHSCNSSLKLRLSIPQTSDEGRATVIASLVPTFGSQAVEVHRSLARAAVSHCSQNGRGAEAFAAFTSVARTAVKKGVVTVTDVFHHLIKSNPEPPGPS